MSPVGSCRPVVQTSNSAICVTDQSVSFSTARARPPTKWYPEARSSAHCEPFTDYQMLKTSQPSTSRLTVHSSMACTRTGSPTDTTGWGNRRSSGVTVSGTTASAPTPTAARSHALERRDMTKTVTLIRSAALSNVAQYAYAATVPSDTQLIFLAGSCPLNDDGSAASVGDYAGQATKCLENMRIALREAKADIFDVVSTRVLVASAERSDLALAWEVVRETFGDHDVPSTLLGVTVLGYEDQLVEIEAVAAIRV